MSAEVENSKDEETKEQPKKNLKEKLQKNWQIGIKILEMLLSAVCIGCAYNSIRITGIGNSDLHHVGIMYTSFTGYILINATLLASYFVGDVIPFKTCALFSIIGAALFLITGVLLIVDRSTYISHYIAPSDRSPLVMLLVSGILSLANAVVFTADALICGACTGFFYEPARAIALGQNYLHQIGIVYTAFTGYMLINAALLIGKAIGDSFPYKTLIIFAFEGAILFLISGILLLICRVTIMTNTVFHPNMYLVSLMTTSISCAFVNVIVFSIDAFFTYLKRKDL